MHAHNMVMPLGVLAFIAIVGVLLYWRSQSFMQERLREYLRATAATAVMQFDPAVITRLDPETYATSPAYRDVVDRLNRIRRDIPSVRYAYIMQQTENPTELRFVADADSLLTREELDENGNGTVDEDELPSYPGDTYDIADVPALLGPAFLEPAVDEDIIVDAWGRLISGYAPIKDEKGITVAVLGIDMEADAFEQLSTSIFSFEALLVLLLGGAFLAFYVGLEMWRRRLEAVEQLEADRRALLDLVSHQLGTPLTTFKWWLEILKERDGGKICRDTEICIQLEEGIKRIDAIIQALRSADMQDADAPRGSSDISVAVEDATREVRPLLERKHQTLAVDVAPNLPPVPVDATLLSGAVEELLENASSYSAEGTTIALSLRLSGKDVLLEVADKGDGIDPLDLPHIAERFTRGRTAMSRKPVGNGLGLWIVRSIVELAGGELWVTSELKKGTTVHIRLPRA